MDIYNMTEAQKRDAYNRAADEGLWSGKGNEMEVKNLYLIWQDENEDREVYVTAVVCAKSEDEARLIHPDEPVGDDWLLDNWVAPEFVQVKFIGLAADNIKPGSVIMTDYAI